MFKSTLFALIFIPNAFSFEKTTVLPQNVRSLSFSSVSTNAEEKTDEFGQKISLASALNKPLLLKDLLQGQSELKKSLLLGFFKANEFDLTENVAEISAHTKANIQVHVGMFSYGLTDKLTLAIALPFYQAKVTTEVGYTLTNTAQKIYDTLDNSLTAQHASAQEFSEKMNDIVGSLNKKLTNNGYKSLSSWQDKGIGDVVLAAKYKALDHQILKLATAFGTTLPTGKVKDPDALTSLPFGEGSTQLFASFLTDQYLADGLFFNEYAKITYPLSGKHNIRMITAEEKIAVEKKEITLNKGTKLDAGFSLQYEPAFGLVSGVGYHYFSKQKDHIEDVSFSTEELLTHNTDQKAHEIEAKIGFSTVPLFKRKEAPLPLIASLEYTKQLASENKPVSDFIRMDLSLFF